MGKEGWERRGRKEEEGEGEEEGGGRVGRGKDVEGEQ